MRVGGGRPPDPDLPGHLRVAPDEAARAATFSSSGDPLRRILGVSALVLALLGVELAAGGVSTVLERLVRGMGAVMRGEESLFPGYRLVAGWALLAGALAMVGALAWAGRAARAVRSDGSSCPRCGADTRRIKRRRRHRLLAHLLERGLTRRSCDRCGWKGLAAST